MIEIKVPRFTVPRSEAVQMLVVHSKVGSQEVKMHNKSGSQEVKVVQMVVQMMVVHSKVRSKVLRSKVHKPLRFRWR